MYGRKILIKYIFIYYILYIYLYHHQLTPSTGADSNTLTLISTFMTATHANNINHLLLIIAYRYNEVTEGHLLLQTLSEVKVKGVLRELYLDDLVEEDVVMLIEDSFNKNPSKSIYILLFYYYFIISLLSYKLIKNPIIIPKEKK
jgi:hypothetical protein